MVNRRKHMKKKKKIIPLINIVLLLVTCVVVYVIYVSGTNARYKSDVSGTASAPTAKWAMKVNEVDIVNGATSFGIVPITLSSTTKVAPNMIAPGMVAVASFDIDPSGVEVSFEYDIELGNIVGAPTAFEVVVKAGGVKVEPVNGKYSGIKMLQGNTSAMTALDKIPITIEVLWKNNEANNANDTEVALLISSLELPIAVTAKQHIKLTDYFRGVEVSQATNIFTDEVLNTDITIRNNDGTEYMMEPLVYTISASNPKFDVVMNDVTGGVLEGGSAKANVISVTISKKTAVVLQGIETVDIVFNIISPFTAQKVITIGYKGYDQNGLTLRYDGINNTGAGHSNNPSVWKDLVGNNDGIITGTAAWDDRGLEFNGQNTKVKFNGNINNTYTLGLVILPVLTGTHPRLIGEESGNQRFPSVYLHSNTSYKIALYAQRLDKVFPDTTVPSTTEKTSVVVTYSNNLAKLYVNGAFVGELELAYDPASGANAYLGDNGGSLRAYKGKIYNFLVYDRALTATEIEHNFEVDRLRFGT